MNQDQMKTNDINLYHPKVRLRKQQIDLLNSIATREKKRRSEIIRDAIDYYALNYGTGQLDLQQTELTREVRRIEERLSGLLIKLHKLCGQNVYWTALQWFDGPPKARLNQEGINYQWNKSTKFALELLCVCGGKKNSEKNLAH